MLTNRVKLNRRRIAPLLRPGEQAVACTQVRLGRGADWLEGAAAPSPPPPPSRLDRALRVTEAVAELGASGLAPEPGPPAVRDAFDVAAAGPAGSQAYRLVHAARGLRLLRDSLYCVVTGQRLIFAASTATSAPFTSLVDAALREVAGVARRREALLIEFADASFVRIAVMDSLASREAGKLAGLLAPGGERQPDLARYAPPWARLA